MLLFNLCRHLALAGCALWLAANLAQAQDAAARAERPDPLDPQARVPPATYHSALATYRRLGDDKPLPWKQANEAVNRIGGWRAYAREAQLPEPAASTPAARSAAPSAAGSAPTHGGHKPQ